MAVELSGQEADRLTLLAEKLRGPIRPKLEGQQLAGFLEDLADHNAIAITPRNALLRRVVDELLRFDPLGDLAPARASVTELLRTTPFGEWALVVGERGVARVHCSIDVVKRRAEAARDEKEAAHYRLAEAPVDTYAAAALEHVANAASARMRRLEALERSIESGRDLGPALLALSLTPYQEANADDPERGRVIRDATVKLFNSHAMSRTFLLLYEPLLTLMDKNADASLQRSSGPRDRVDVCRRLYELAREAKPPPRPPGGGGAVGRRDRPCVRPEDQVRRALGGVGL